MTEFACVIWKVEHGSAAFVRTPNNKTVMFDAGSSEKFSPASYLAMKHSLNATDKKLDKIIISHADRDHITDLPQVVKLLNPRILSRNRSVPSDVLYPDGAADLQEPLVTYKRMNDHYNTEIAESDKELPIENWGGCLIKGFCCSPSQLTNCAQDKIKNNASLLSYVGFNDFEIVFPGDLEPLGWEALINNTEIKNYVGKAKLRILVASHHGRKSGIRYSDNGQDKVYDSFLNLMKPHLVIISDKWGNETTDPEAYRNYCLGYNVYFKNEKKTENTKVLTTKSNLAVAVLVTNGSTSVAAF